jgi:hypothetical protein
VAGGLEHQLLILEDHEKDIYILFIRIMRDTGWL